MRKAIKYLSLAFSIFILLLLAVLVFTQTELFMNYVRNQALKQVNSNINGKLSFERLEGNLFNTLRLHNIVLKESDTIVAQIQSLSFKYHITSFKNKRLAIDTVLIKAPNINLCYKDSSTWRIVYALKKRLATQKKENFTFPLTLDINHFEILNGQSTFQKNYTSPIQNIKELSLTASGHIKDKFIEVSLEKMNLSADQIKINHAHLNFIKDDSQVTFDSLMLHTEKSVLAANGRYKDKSDFSIMLKAMPLDSKDIKYLIPSLPIKSISTLQLNLGSEKDTVSYNLLLGNNTKHIDLKGTALQLPQALTNPKIKSKYDANIYFSNFVPDEWFHIKKTHANLNGVLSIKGNNILDYKDDLKINVEFNQSSYKKIIADTLSISAIQQNNTITANIFLAYNKSRNQGHLTCQNIYYQPTYTVDMETKDLNLQDIIPQLTNTAINGQIHVQGKHFKSDQRLLNTAIKLQESKLYGIQCDSVLLHSKLHGSDLLLDTLILYTKHSTANSKGHIDLNNQNFVGQLHVTSENIKELKQFGVPDLNFKKAAIELNANGTPQNFDYKGQILIADLEINKINSKNIQGITKGSFRTKNMTSTGLLALDSIQLKSVQLDSVTLEYSLTNKKLNAQLNLIDSTHNALINADLFLKDTLIVCLHQAELMYPNTHYYLTDTIQQFKYKNQNTWVDNIEIKDHKNHNFIIKGQGMISLQQSEYFDLLIRNFDLSRISPFINASDSIGGILSTALSLRGQADSIKLTGNYDITNPLYRNMNFPNIKGNIDYSEDSIKMHAWLPQLDSSIYANVAVHVATEYNSENGFKYDISKAIKAQLTIDSLNIKTPDNKHYKHIKGEAVYSGRLNMDGDINTPQFSGLLHVDNGFFTNHNKGIYYKNTHGRIKFDKNTIIIDTMFVESEKGFLASAGHITFDSTIISGKIINAALQTNIDNFQLVKHKNYSINISGNPFIASIKKSPTYGGTLTVNQSSFYLPAIMKSKMTQTDEVNTPLLLAAITKNDTAQTIESSEHKNIKSPVTDQLQGRLTIDIPRSTWLKSDDMNVEIAGDFDIAKSGAYFELFGDVEIIRGHYILYGRKFDISEGIITFMGREKIDPRLEIKASYTFRGSDKEKQTLQLSVSEFLSEPTINFTLNETPITQSDAVSIMIFGKTMDELSYSNQNGIIGSVGSNMLANMVSSSLNSTLGQRFKLDMIEVNSTENWQTAAFVVGKYITNDLFVIYQRGFGETEGEEITPETITLEYELNKILFFRLQGGSSKTSGFDVILKFESKK